MKDKKFIMFSSRMTTFFELALVVIVGIGILVALKDLVEYFPAVWASKGATSYELFKDFLGHVLLIVIGVELMLMLINHTVISILELVLFVIARKMLIYSDTMEEIILGSLSLLIITVILRFLILKDDGNFGTKFVTFEGDARLKDIQRSLGTTVFHEDIGKIGDIINSLNGDDPPYVGMASDIGDLTFMVEEIEGEEIIKVKAQRKGIRF